MAKNNDVNPQYKNTCFLVGQAMLSMAVASPTCAESIMTLLNIDLIANKTYSADELNTMNKVMQLLELQAEPVLQRSAG
ncbi:MULTISPECIES: hypothetical protein [Duffyella]|jgi:hypothetical protein|uniref:Uncharacterized protein n=1 Tax=Duffyella gerundensis TaxID=1619313 RepID=A0A0U5EAB7_9GAMM|nr:hypothetical protein [Duffyella gerundensis]QTO55714.1 hypothetical protein J8I88_07650 [Duffyella gerundensis]CUU24157.1 hypothetical protein EM595_1923 [Duffyella gerundensis]